MDCDLSNLSVKLGSMSEIELFLDSYGLLAIFGIMLLKEFGIPVPIPGDLIMLGVAARAAQGRMSPVEAFVAILVPMLIGGFTQFVIARGPGRALIYRIGRRIGLTQARLDRAMDRIRRGGTAAVVVGLTTPGLRIATTPASGLANLAPRAYVPGLVLGSAFFLGWHFAIGYAGGAALAAFNVSTPMLLLIGIAVIVFGILAMVIARRRKAYTHHPETAQESFANWTDAACPVCAALTLAQATRERKLDDAVAAHLHFRIH